MSDIPAPSTPVTRGQRVRVALALTVLGLTALAGVPVRDPGPVQRASQVQARAQAELEAALEAYRTDHGRWPGRDAHGRTDPILLRAQLCGTSGHDGLPPEDPDAQVFGPYLPGGVPLEPASASDHLWIGERCDGDGDGGWQVDVERGRVAPRGVRGSR